MSKPRIGTYHTDRPYVVRMHAMEFTIGRRTVKTKALWAVVIPGDHNASYEFPTHAEAIAYADREARK